MKKDWEQHKDDEKFEYPMTLCYTPYPAFLAPEGYGLVVVDMQKDTILSCQGYTSFGNIHVAGMIMSMDIDYEDETESDVYRDTREWQGKK